MINLKEDISKERIAFLQARDKQEALAKLMLSGNPGHRLQCSRTPYSTEYIIPPASV
jgi:hypothetical protein